MNLLQLRQQFRSISGRHDLVDAVGADTGADFYINEGRKFLDQLDETQKSWASCFRFLEVGFWAVQFPQCRAIKEVWAATTTAHWQLEKESLQDLLTTYMTTVPSSIDPGDSLYYSPAVNRYIPEDATADEFDAFIGYTDIIAGSGYDYNAVIVMPPPDEKLLIEIKGLFWSMELVRDTDQNYWSASHPMLLIMATMRQIEIINRNTQGVRDWEISIRTAMAGLGMDLVEELVAEADEMEG